MALQQKLQMPLTKDDFYKTPIKIHNIRVYLDKLHQHTNLGSLVDELSVDVNIQLTQSQEMDDGVDIILVVDERNRTFKAGTEIGHQYVGFLMSFPNTIGIGDNLDLLCKTGIQEKSPFNIVYSIPYRCDPERKFSFSLFNHYQSVTPHKPYSDESIGVRTGFNFPGIIGMHSFCYEASWRSISSFTPSVSSIIRRQAGHNLKSSVSHSFQHSTLNHPLVPTKGYSVKLHQELSGLGGSALGFTARNGFIVPLQGQNLNILDKFFIGGPTSIRGFNARGIGPRDRLDALGGDIFYEFGANASFPLPNIQRDVACGHIFVNAGNLANVFENGLDNIGQKVQNFLNVSPPNVSVGIGAILTVFKNARVEFNAVLPIKATNGSISSSGFQFGIGLELL
ncbi:hypothetical protein ROZALSC1DRAFT_28275 [Rozella allomycis CSF55]|uniref:Bacterial surface antigen (D15) domain-containing protein n=1 Tax=Rozella allomycis (strain CSF55) TaxID=988480 RepID=A0A4P9YKT1_ROZAC|nr:hypothetical protein ROZALSC1DRAFT_28275 [Rozella allomycis CSF55]